MHSEYAHHLPQATADLINHTHDNGHHCYWHVTVTRTETAYQKKQLRHWSATGYQYTDIFIYPSFNLKL
jgi:S-adenosylmethionine:tRNA-ribosyltransferase-isomerase (queuine synthetase)